MKKRDQKPPKDDSVNEAPTQPDGVRRPSEGGVGREYSKRPVSGGSAPKSSV
jgi:hypothetical protein